MSDATPRPLEGVFSPVVTPLDENLAPAAERFVKQCRWLLTQNCNLAVFGTNSEANSLAGAQRRKLLDALIDAGLDPARMMPGTGFCSLAESVETTAHAVGRGVGGVLMLPPFYYKGVSEDGLFAYFSEVVQRVGDSRLRVYLYHIPQVAQVGIPLGLIERLLKAYPGTIAGIKDSSGDWSNTKAMLDSFPDFRVFVGSESFLLANMRNGGVGCISATANVNPAAIDRLWRNWQSDKAEAMQAELDTIRNIVASYPMIPALKATVAHFTGDDDWARVMPPLVALNAEQRAGLARELDAAGFAMPGLAEAA